MSRQTVDIKHVDKAIEKILETYSYDVQKELQKTVDSAGKDYREKIIGLTNEAYKQKKFELYKYGSKSKEGPYVNLFFTRTLGTLARRLGNKEYRLSHLIENGHQVKNQFGGPYDIHPTKQIKGKWVYGSEYGTSGKKTIALNMWDKTVQFIEEDLPKRIEEKIRKIKP